jgi:hypothetical protein
MKRTWGFLAVGLLFSVTACSFSITVPHRPPPPPHGSAVSRTPPPVSPDLVLDACPFLAVGEVAHLQIVIPLKPDSTSVAFVDETAKASCREPFTTIGGVGDKTMYCESGKDPAKAVLLVGKLSRGEVRLAVLELAKTQPDAYEKIAKLLARRL